jgi:hypothetical protein
MAWSKKEAPAIIAIPTIKANTASILGAISVTSLINISLRALKRIKKGKLERIIDVYSTRTVTGHCLRFLKVTLDEMDRYPEMEGHCFVTKNALIHSSTDIGEYIHSQ